MRIPRQFRLFGRVIRVEYLQGVYHEDGAFGWADYRNNRIQLQRSSQEIPIPRDNIEQTYLHELVHHVLYAAKDDEFDPPLHSREGLVDRIAALLHQALTTADGDLDAED